MSVIVARPPNFDEIMSVFPNADKPGVIFAYGEDVYNPSGRDIPEALLAHERVHQTRQWSGCFSRALLDPPEQVKLWWKFYLTDQKFRYNEELLAHVAEFKAQDSRALDRNYRAKLLQTTASRLVDPLYAYQPPRSMSVAIRDIRWKLDEKQR